MFSFIKQKYQLNQIQEVTIHLDSVQWICDPIYKDHYRIHIFSSGDTQVTYGNERSKLYSTYALEALKEKSCQAGVYEGGPDFALRGIIEGFYGTPWTHQTRLQVIDFIHQYHMNAYFYAPKDDQYHRELWRTLYPEKPLENLKELIFRADEKLVDFYFCISPGKDFDYTKPEEFEHLFQKIKQVMSFGVRHFCLLMDDIDYKLNEEALKQFERPGLAHAHISNQLNQYLKANLDTYTLVMCPTEYWQNWNTPYRSDLKDHLDDDIKVFWTGYNTIAEYIPDIDGIKAQEVFGHELILWDNYPVNDMDTDRIFLGPLRNRGRRLSTSHIGMISNPMIQWELSKIPVITMALYMWDGSSYDPNLALNYAIDEVLDEQRELKDALSCFVEDNISSLIHEQENSLLSQAISNKDIDFVLAYMKKLKESTDVLLKSFKNQAFIDEAKPWFDDIAKSYTCLLNIKNGLSCELDIKQEKAHHGTHVVYEYLKSIGQYEGPTRKRERPNFWDQKGNQK